MVPKDERRHEMEAVFGPAGNAESFAAAGFRATADAPAWLAQMGLTAYEYQCGRGVRVGHGYDYGIVGHRNIPQMVGCKAWYSERPFCQCGDAGRNGIRTQDTGCRECPNER